MLCSSLSLSCIPAAKLHPGRTSPQPLSDMLAASSLDSGLSGLAGLALLPAGASFRKLDVTMP